MDGYVEFIQGGLKNRGNVVPLGSVKITNDYSCFRSLFVYDESLREYADKNGSVAKYKGSHSTDMLFFDFDGDNLYAVREEVIKFVQYLISEYGIPEAFIYVYFSGNKGFHIIIPFVAVGNIQPSKDFYIKYKKFIEILTKDFKYIDTSIYDPLRVVRISNTKHEKSGLYKIPLTVYELGGDVDISFLEEYAKIKHNVKFLHPDEMIPVTELEKLWVDMELFIQSEKEQTKPQEVKPSNGFVGAIASAPEVGGRHSALSKIAGYLIDKDIPYNEGLAICRTWNDNNATPMDDERLEHDLKSLYDSYWESRPMVPQSATPDFSEIMVQGVDYFRHYLKHISRIKKGGRIKTGYSIIDEPMRGLIAGEVLTVVGKTSIGKSAFAQNIVLNNVELDRWVLFFSLEMPLPTVVERTLQRYMNRSGREIERRYFSGDPYIENESKSILGGLNKFITIPVQGIRYEKIEEYILKTEDAIKEKLDLVVIDYAGLMKTNKGSIYEQQSEISRDLKALSGRTGTAVITLAQVSKQYKETDPIDLDATRDSGVIVEASDYVIGLWRDEEENTENILLKGNLCKNRNGNKVMFNAKMNRINLTFQIDKHTYPFAHDRSK